MVICSSLIMNQFRSGRTSAHACQRHKTGFHHPLKHAKHPSTNADVAELVDARDLKSLDGNVVWVRVPPPAPTYFMAKRVRRSESQGGLLDVQRGRYAQR